MAKYTREEHKMRQGEQNSELRKAANAINLPEFLINQGFDVKKESSKDDYVIKNSRLGKIRLSFGEVWLCHIDSEKPINAVQLVERLHGLTNMEAAKYILGISASSPLIKDNTYAVEKAQEKQNNDLSELPEPSAAHISAGVEYLAERGIDRATFEMLRSAGNAEYVWNGLAFIGRDESGAPKMQETRLINDLPNKEEPGKLIRHLGANGSLKKYSVVIPGTNDKNVEIVEGNFDGMALFEMNKRLLPANEQPTIIISGGKDNLKFLENPAIVELLKNAESIKCYGDNEKLELKDFDDIAEKWEAELKKQEKSDAAHLNRIEMIRLISPSANIEYKKPQYSYKDLADMNQKLKPLLALSVKTVDPVKKFNF